MRILLTGGAGYIGSHTAVVLSRLDHDVVLFDNLSNSGSEVIERISKISGKDIEFFYGDVRDTPALRFTINKYCVDAVIHFAGLKSVGDSVVNPIDYYANNVQGTISLVQAMQETSVRTLVFSSSATVYGQPEYLPLDERHPVRATNPYGRSKVHVEDALNDLSASNPDWRVVCLRYFNPVGAHESGLIGENPSGQPNNLMPYLAQVASGMRPHLNIFGNNYPTPDGTGVRDFIHVMDLAEGHAAALDFLTTHVGWHAINLGTGLSHSVIEMVCAFERASGKKIPYQVVSRRHGDVAACYADPSKAAELLNWKACRTLEDMCASAWNYQKFQTR